MANNRYEQWLAELTEDERDQVTVLNAYFDTRSNTPGESEYRQASCTRIQDDTRHNRRTDDYDGRIARHRVEIPPAAGLHDGYL